MTGPQACRVILAHYQQLRQQPPQQPHPSPFTLSELLHDLPSVSVASATSVSASAPSSSSSSVVIPPVIIALTASCMESDREASRAAGHADFIAKPLSLATLRQRITHWAQVIAAQKQAATSSFLAASAVSGTI
jgi:CheY-like chemotaxis protein